MDFVFVSSLLQAKRTSCECITCHGFETRFCTMTLRWRRSRGGSMWATWRAVSTTKLVRFLKLRCKVKRKWCLEGRGGIKGLKAEQLRAQRLL